MVLRLRKTFLTAYYYLKSIGLLLIWAPVDIYRSFRYNIDTSIDIQVTQYKAFELEDIKNEVIDSTDFDFDGNSNN